MWDPVEEGPKVPVGRKRERMARRITGRTGRWGQVSVQPVGPH